MGLCVGGTERLWRVSLGCASTRQQLRRYLHDWVSRSIGCQSRIEVCIGTTWRPACGGVGRLDGGCHGNSSSSSSGGDISTIGYLEVLDVKAALKYALAQPGVQYFEI